MMLQDSNLCSERTRTVATHARTQQLIPAVLTASALPQRPFSLMLSPSPLRCCWWERAVPSLSSTSRGHRGKQLTPTGSSGSLCDSAQLCTVPKGSCRSLPANSAAARRCLGLCHHWRLISHQLLANAFPHPSANGAVCSGLGAPQGAAALSSCRLAHADTATSSHFRPG